AHATAARGVSTRVDTTVAIEFAASWNPFMKSKARATNMRAKRVSIRSAGGGSGVLEGDALDHVRHVFAAIDRILQVVVDLLPLDDVDGIRAFLEEMRHRATQQRVALVLEAVHLGAVRQEAR